VRLDDSLGPGVELLALLLGGIHDGHGALPSYNCLNHFTEPPLSPARRDGENIAEG
jgi:hypothetical protein